MAHSHPSTPDALRLALEAAWSEGRHSVVEVTTSRARNLEQHRALQKRVAAAAACALKLRENVCGGGGGGGGGDGLCRSDAAAPIAAKTPRVKSARVSRFSLPMLRKPTTLPAAAAADDDDDDGGAVGEGEWEKEGAGSTREGWLLRVELESGAVGWGEASPLPGLHRETAAEAGATLRAVASLLDGGSAGSYGSSSGSSGSGGGVNVPPELALLGGAVSIGSRVRLAFATPPGCCPRFDSRWSQPCSPRSPPQPPKPQVRTRPSRGCSFSVPPLRVIRRPPPPPRQRLRSTR